jgi:microcystin-dependent protein
MDPFLGEVRMAAFNFAPQGWALCNGQSLPINQNQALFALLGTTYGGDGTTTFNLPKLPDHASPSKTPAESVLYIIALTGIFPPRP